jgi:hypothetical protein
MNARRCIVLKLLIGRELLPSELEPPCVVWKDGAYVAWVIDVSPDEVVLWAGIPKHVFRLRRKGESLADEEGEVRLYEYRG